MDLSDVIAVLRDNPSIIMIAAAVGALLILVQLFSSGSGQRSRVKKAKTCCVCGSSDVIAFPRGEFDVCSIHSDVMDSKMMLDDVLKSIDIDPDNCITKVKNVMEHVPAEALKGRFDSDDIIETFEAMCRDYASKKLHSDTDIERLCSYLNTFQELGDEYYYVE
jgi:hypothetical protein